MYINDSERMEVDQNAESNSLIFHDSVPELIQLTCFKLTTNLWSCSLRNPADNLENTFKNRIDDLIKELNTKISDSTKNSITWYSKRILKLSSMWLSYHKERVFKDWDVELIRGVCFPELIWRPDGSIDYFKSAQALIDSSNLNDEQEYKLVCLYCMEDRIINMWPRLVENQSVLLDVFFDEEISLLSYWNCRMAGYFSHSGMKFVENRILANDTIDNLSAAVYFFNRLAIEERVEKGCQLILCVKLDERAEYVKTMLQKFDQEELHRAFKFHCSDIMYPLMMNRVYAQSACQVWDRVKGVLTVQSFLSIMIRITATLRVALKDPDGRFANEIDDYDDFKRNIFTIVGDLWLITPNTLKKHDLVSSWRGVIYTLVQHFIDMKIDWDPEARFIFNIMSAADDIVYYRLLSKFDEKLVLMFHSRIVNDLIDARDLPKYRHAQSRVLNYSYTKSLASIFCAKKFAKVKECIETCIRSDSWHRQKSFILRHVFLLEKPVDFFHPFELNEEEVDQLRKFISEAVDEVFYHDYTQLFSYYPRLWPVPIAIDDDDDDDDDNDLYKCYAGLERS